MMKNLENLTEENLTEEDIIDLYEECKKTKLMLLGNLKLDIKNLSDTKISYTTKIECQSEMKEDKILLIWVENRLQQIRAYAKEKGINLEPPKKGNAKFTR